MTRNLKTISSHNLKFRVTGTGKSAPAWPVTVTVVAGSLPSSLLLMIIMKLRLVQVCVRFKFNSESVRVTVNHGAASRLSDSEILAWLGTNMKMKSDSTSGRLRYMISYNDIHDIISCWYWLWYHGFQSDYDIIDLWYHGTMISYFCDYDINNLWYHRSMISWPIS
jgi:hypothetical protein